MTMSIIIKRNLCLSSNGKDFEEILMNLNNIINLLEKTNLYRKWVNLFARYSRNSRY